METRASLKYFVNGGRTNEMFLAGFSLKHSNREVLKTVLFRQGFQFSVEFMWLPYKLL